MARKRGNSEGTIRKRSDGRWEARAVLANGKRKSFYGETRQEAARQLSLAIRDRELGIVDLDERQTVADFLTTWLQAERFRVKRTSAHRYEREIRLHLLPKLKGITLTKLTAQHIATLYATELAHGRSPNAVAYTHRVLHAALADAFRLGLVHRNVADLVDPPRKTKRIMAVYTEEQARALLQAAVGDRFEALWILALATGMREGELLGLAWPQVDLLRGTVTVLVTLQQYPGEAPAREEVKTSHSERVIALPKVVVGALERHHEQQREQRAKLGEVWSDMNLVFPNTIGRPVDVRGFRRRCWHRLVKKAELPYIRFHDLRHTAATLLLARGMPVKAVSEMLGHSSATITLNLYGHVLPHMQQQLAQTMDDILSMGEDIEGN